MKLKLLFLSSLIVFVFASCKKCYDCESYSYCTTCTVKDDDGTLLAGGQEYCGEKEDVEDYETAMKSTWGSYGNVTCDQESELDDVTEVCDGSKKAQSRVTILELAGYTCVEK